jgi:hypothetical protein
MRTFYILTLLAIFFACSKKEDEDLLVTCLSDPQMAWLEAKVNELRPCTCLTEIRQGSYNNQQIIEIRVIDPVCNGVNVVYSANGTPILNSSQQEAYAAYLQNLKDARVVWTCSKDKKP